MSKQVDPLQQQSCASSTYGNDTTNTPQKQSGLMSLPPELHYMISEHLIYPDALSLKHVNRHFSNLVDTGVKLKIAWLIQRRQLHLECPNDRTCDLGSDLRFCRGSVPFVYHYQRGSIMKLPLTKFAGFLWRGDENTLNASLEQAWGVSSLEQTGAYINHSRSTGGRSVST